jgi:hypothetical protein
MSPPALVAGSPPAAPAGVTCQTPPGLAPGTHVAHPLPDTPVRAGHAFILRSVRADWRPRTAACRASL